MPTDQFEANERIDAAAADKALAQARNAQDDAATYWDLQKTFRTSAGLESYISRLKPSQSSPHDQGVLAAYRRHEARKASDELTAKVKKERRTYGPDNPENSYIADVAAKRMQDMGHMPITRNFDPTGAATRLARYEDELRYEYTQRSDEGLRVRRSVIDSYRREHGTNADHSDRALRDLLQTRATSTASNSLGDFVPPVYLLDVFARYLTAAASVSSQGNQLPLPPTGMKVDIPIVSTVTNLTTKQSADNASISSMDPEATYSTQAVNTYAGYAEISQQLLDRFGGINGNGLTFDQAFAKLVARQAGTALDTDIITAITGAAQTVTNSGSATFGAFLGDVAKAIVDIETEAGQELPVSHVWVPSYNLRWYQAQLGTNNQPVWAPAPNGTGGRVGRLGASNEGYTGYDIAGAMVFQNANLPTTGGSSAYNTVLVGNPEESLLVLSSDPVLDVWPQAFANQLSVSVSVRKYVAWANLYPSGWVQISGAAYPSSSLTFA